MRGALNVNQKHPTFDIELELDYLEGEDAMDYVDRDANLESNLKRWSIEASDMAEAEWENLN